MAGYPPGPWLAGPALISSPERGSLAPRRETCALPQARNKSPGIGIATLNSRLGVFIMLTVGNQPNGRRLWTLRPPIRKNS